MQSFKPNYLKKLKILPDVSWLIGSCMEARGKEAFLFSKKPEMLDTLTELAIIQSTESSNRIEGVWTDSKRLPLLLKGEIKPISRPEQEILGYKKALEWIHTDFDNISIDTKTILKLHKICQQGEMATDAGEFKKKNNQIIEITKNGERKIRFTPVEAKETSKFVEQLCLAYNDLINKKEIPELLIISSFVFDFLCIHPFRDGNGRVSRLLTLLLLYQNNYRVGKFISIERIIEDTKNEYYRNLKESSAKWHEGKHNLWPWHRYFLSTLKDAYREFNIRLEDIKDTSKNKTDLIRQTILNELGEFTLTRISHKLQNVSEAMIKKVLAELKDKGLVKLKGKGRGAKWKVKSN